MQALEKKEYLATGEYVVIYVDAEGDKNTNDRKKYFKCEFKKQTSFR